MRVSTLVEFPRSLCSLLLPGNFDRHGAPLSVPVPLPERVSTINVESPGRRLGGRGSLVASVAGPEAGVAEEARTRSFAAPALAGCALNENAGW